MCPSILRLPINATLYDSNCHNAQATLRTIGEVSVSGVVCLYANPSLRRSLTMSGVIIAKRLRRSWRKCGGATYEIKHRTKPTPHSLQQRRLLTINKCCVGQKW
jgi:hypothetical protein